MAVIDVGVRAASDTCDNNGCCGNERYERLCVGLGGIGFLGGGVNGFSVHGKCFFLCDRFA